MVSRLLAKVNPCAITNCTKPQHSTTGQSLCIGLHVLCTHTAHWRGHFEFKLGDGYYRTVQSVYIHQTFEMEDGVPAQTLGSPTKRFCVDTSIVWRTVQLFQQTGVVGRTSTVDAATPSLALRWQEPGVVVMDNASIHHVHGISQMISKSGAILMFLPPDYNSIEETFSKIKTPLTRFCLSLCR